MSPKSDRYMSKEYAAPMVRASTLPFREECLRHGADYVFTEEVIDKKILSSHGTTLDDGTVLWETATGFRTLHFRPDRRESTILQIGTADGVLASKAALSVLEYVSEVNVNMGCPKSFSVNGGMGAALLSDPVLACDIVKTLRSSLPSEFPLTCKIRYIGDISNPDDIIKRTSEFIKGLESSGADAVTVHMRTVPMRPREPAVWCPVFAHLVEQSSVPLIANGDFFNRGQIDLFRNKHSNWSNSVMIARGAIHNPSIFSHEQVPGETVVEDFFNTCVKYKEPKQSVKWILAQMMDGFTQYNGMPVKKVRDRIHQAKGMSDMKAAISLRLDAVEAVDMDTPNDTVDPSDMQQPVKTISKKVKY